MIFHINFYSIWYFNKLFKVQYFLKVEIYILNTDYIYVRNWNRLSTLILIPYDIVKLF